MTVNTVYAQTRLHEPIRHNSAAVTGESGSNPAGVYTKWQREMPAEFEATAEDAAYATLTFRNGVVGQYIEDHARVGTRQLAPQNSRFPRFYDAPWRQRRRNYYPQYRRTRND